MNQDEFNRQLEKNGLGELISTPVPESFPQWGNELFQIDCLLMSLIRKCGPQVYGQFLQALRHCIQTAPLRYGLEDQERRDEQFWQNLFGADPDVQ